MRRGSPSTDTGQGAGRSGGIRAGAGPASAAPAIVDEVLTRGEAVWGRFIETYSPFIIGCARRVAGDYDERMDIYLYVCSHLRADDCRRLRQFRGAGSNGPCQFTTWLGTVVHNMAREWVRTKRGRRRLFRSVEGMTELDRLVFRYRFWEGFAVGEIARTLRISHGLRTSEARVVRSLREIGSSLGRDQRWRLLTGARRGRRHGSLEDGEGGPQAGAASLPRDPTWEVFARGVAAAALRDALEHLGSQERAALELRYRDGLSARLIAERLRIPCYKRVYELQARALVKLRRYLVSAGVGPRDFEERAGVPEGLL